MVALHSPEHRGLGQTYPSNRTKLANQPALPTPRRTLTAPLDAITCAPSTIKGTDMSLFKEVRIKDRYGAKFTFDAFNALNLAVWGQPNSSFNDPNFGKVTGTYSGPRTVQMSGKFTF